ncbi:hypothetical protein HYALB_00010210 [Hymenoscyphus albidus]|uniref:Uncharacterized protein n=1 Tax=Hymenoscyphus albidus TaxID=595503 RepID=A0A9N9LLV7_9HELO|nr:hypothetical protein HYALB_00010210 [Hymenoscyphus albidus]
MQFSSAIVAIFGASLAIMPVVFGAPQGGILGSCYAGCLVEKKDCDKLLAACEKDCKVSHAE